MEEDNETKGYKFYLGQTVYSAHNWQIGRYVVVEFVTRTTIEGTKLEYVLEDPTGRKVGFTEEEIKTCFFETLDEARVLSLQGWEIEVKKITKQIKTIDDKVFDKITEQTKAKQEQKTNA